MHLHLFHFSIHTLTRDKGRRTLMTLPSLLLHRSQMYPAMGRAPGHRNMPAVQGALRLPADLLPPGRHAQRLPLRGERVPAEARSLLHGPHAGAARGLAVHCLSILERNDGAQGAGLAPECPTSEIRFHVTHAAYGRHAPAELHSATKLHMAMPACAR